MIIHKQAGYTLKLFIKPLTCYIIQINFGNIKLLLCRYGFSSPNQPNLKTESFLNNFGKLSQIIVNTLPTLAVVSHLESSCMDLETLCRVQPVGHCFVVFPLVLAAKCLCYLFLAALRMS